MPVYIECENGIITLNEWLSYVNTDSELTLSENSAAVNTITRSPMKFKIPGRVIWCGYEIVYKQGRIVCVDFSKELLEKLRMIAAALCADVFDCGEQIKRTPN